MNMEEYFKHSEEYFIYTKRPKTVKSLKKMIVHHFKGDLAFVVYEGTKTPQSISIDFIEKIS